MPSRRRRVSRDQPIAVLTSPTLDGRPLYTQLYVQLREHILGGVLAPGTKLPSSRTLATDLRIARNTVEAAIGQLCAEGFVQRRVGAGTVVSGAAARVVAVSRGAAGPRAAPTAKRPSQHVVAAVPPLSTRGARIAAGGDVELRIDARVGPDATAVPIFPVQVWSRLVARVARTQTQRLLRAGDIQGELALRRAISDHLRLTRGLQCSPDDVIVVQSTQQSLDLLARLLLADGDTVLIEAPGYRGARAAFAAAGARVEGVPVDDDGVRTDHVLGRSNARLLYLTPSHQYPLGGTLPLERRMEALAWARREQAWIVEDDYDSEIRYSGRPIAALQGLDTAGRVIYLGTFNKVLSPAIRLAYLVLPPALVPPVRAARRLMDGAASPLLQAATALFLAEGHFAAHLRKARRVYEARRHVLLARVSRRLGHMARLRVSETGLHVVAHLPGDLDDAALAAAGSGMGLWVEPLSGFYPKATAATPAPRGLLFGFGAASEEAIRRAVDAIARAAHTTPHRQLHAGPTSPSKRIP